MPGFIFQSLICRFSQDVVSWSPCSLHSRLFPVERFAYVKEIVWLRACCKHWISFAGRGKFAASQDGVSENNGPSDAALKPSLSCNISAAKSSKRWIWQSTFSLIFFPPQIGSRFWFALCVNSSLFDLPYDFKDVLNVHQLCISNVDLIQGDISHTRDTSNAGW